jgi:hypothetical protein
MVVVAFTCSVADAGVTVTLGARAAGATVTEAVPLAVSTPCVSVAVMVTGLVVALTPVTVALFGSAAVGTTVTAGLLDVHVTTGFAADASSMCAVSVCGVPPTCSATALGEMLTVGGTPVHVTVVLNVEAGVLPAAATVTRIVAVPAEWQMVVPSLLVEKDGLVTVATAGLVLDHASAVAAVVDEYETRSPFGPRSQYVRELPSASGSWDRVRSFGGPS